MLNSEIIIQMRMWLVVVQLKAYTVLSSSNRLPNFFCTMKTEI